MGPRFTNRGYRPRRPVLAAGGARLQWVHGSRTVVIGWYDPENGQFVGWLQWVHGSRTVVISRSDSANGSTLGLQWVHGSRTVVIPEAPKARYDSRPASMGPRFTNRGYRRALTRFRTACTKASMGPRFTNRGYPVLSL